MTSSTPREKSASIINSALDNLRQFEGRQTGPNAAQLLVDVTAVQAQLATASALLAISDALDTTGRRLESAVLKLAENVRKGTGGHTS